MTEVVNKENFIEISRTFKLKPTLWNIDLGSFTIVESFKLGNLIAIIKFYPNGRSVNTDTFSIHFGLRPEDDPKNDVPKTDTRNVTCIVRCLSKIFAFDKVVSSFGQTNTTLTGWFVSHFLPIDFVKKNPSIKITMRLHNLHCHSDITLNETKLSVEKQHETLYKLSKLNGDVTLIVLNENDNDNIDNDIQTQPPNKKRRLNNNSNTNNNNNNNNNNNESDYVSLNANGENEIKMSGIILQSASPVFKSMLSNNMLERKEKKITIYANDIQSVDDMIYFMCTNKLRNDANAMNVMKLANYYQMQRLEYECINKMIKEITVKNFVETVNVFDRYGIKDGYNALIEFAKGNVDELKKVDNFDELSHPFKMAAMGLGK